MFGWRLQWLVRLLLRNVSICSSVCRFALPGFPLSISLRNVFHFPFHSKTFPFSIPLQNVSHLPFVSKIFQLSHRFQNVFHFFIRLQNFSISIWFLNISTVHYLPKSLQFALYTKMYSTFRSIPTYFQCIEINFMSLQSGLVIQQSHDIIIKKEPEYNRYNDWLHVSIFRTRDITGS